MSRFDRGTARWLPELRRLWKAAFGDSDEFLDRFFATAFDPDRCRCVVEKGEVFAALYWFDVSCEGQRLAYLYAVATAPEHRSRGLCKALMADTLRLLRQQGYAGALLVPGDEGLAQMYARMGFSPCTTISEIHCIPALPAAPLRQISAADYARARRELLPRCSVLQEGENLAFLNSFARFYAGPGWLAVISVEGTHAHCPELLGDTAAGPHILSALGLTSGLFRCPGNSRKFAMLCPLSPVCVRPEYFALAFD